MADIGTVQRPAASGTENMAALNSVGFCVFEQPSAQFFLQDNSSAFSFQPDFRPAGARRLHRDELKFSDPDPGSAQRQYRQVEAFVSAAFRRGQKTAVLFVR